MKKCVCVWGGGGGGGEREDGNILIDSLQSMVWEPDYDVPYHLGCSFLFLLSHTPEAMQL